MKPIRGSGGAVALAVAMLAGACGPSGGAADAFRRAGDPGEVGAALARARDSGAVVNGSGAPMLFAAITGAGGDQIVAFDLSAGRVVWRQLDQVAARVAVSRAVVVFARPDGVLAARAMSGGALRWTLSVPAGETTIGYAADDGRVYVVTRPAARPRGCALAGYDAATGARSFRVELDGECGGPAARGGIVAVPRRSQYVTFVDGGSGRVLADLISREQAATFVQGTPRGFFFGSTGVFLASRATASGARDAGGYVAAKLPSFVRPIYAPDMYRPEQAAYSALDRNRVVWRAVEDGGRLAFARGVVAVHHFRFFFGVDAIGGAVRWAYVHPRVDAIASAWVGDALLFVAADGEIGALDAVTGRRTFRASFGDGTFLVQGVTFDAEGFAPRGDVEPAADLVDALAEILWDPDKRFSDVKLFAIEELAKQPGPQATRELLKAMDARALPYLISQKALDALVARADPGALDVYTTALRQHADYADDRPAPRLSVLARAVATLKATQAVPELVEHLRLPDTDLDAVAEISRAVIAMDAVEAVPAFTDYLLQYRADPELLERPDALIAAANVLLRLGGARERAALLYVLNDDKTLQAVRLHLRGHLLGGDE